MKAWKSGYALLFVAVLTIAAAPGANAVPIGPSPYLSFSGDSPFSGGSFAYFHLENFEDGLLNTPGVVSAVGSVIGPGAFTDSVDEDDGAIDGNGNSGNSFSFALGSTGITFTFDSGALGSLPTHVGIVWTDGAGTTSFEAFGSSGSLGTIGPVSIADGSFSGTTGEDRFFGWTDPGGILSISISNTTRTIILYIFEYFEIFENAENVDQNMRF